MNKISRRKFIERGVKMAGFAGVGGPWLAELADSRSREKPPAVPSPGSTPNAGGSRFFGTQTHFGQYRAGADAILDLIKDARIGWIRDEVYWSEVEKEKGVFRFPPAYDYYLRAAQARGIQVLLILDFGNAVYSGAEKGAPATEAERQAFARYCREVVKRYKPLGVRHYEIWNEPNASMFWKPQPNLEDYARLLEAAYKSCKDADPGATVLGCSTSGTDLNFIGRVLDAGGGRFMDAVSFHPYCQPLPPEKKLLTDISKLKGIAPGKPLWITEFGYQTDTGAAGVDEETQANYLVRAFLLARSSSVVERVSWYDFQNDGEDRAEPEMNFGLVRKNLSPKPAYAAFKTMASLVRDLPVAEFQIAGNTYFLRLGEGSNRLTAVWRLGGTESVEIPCANGRYRVIDRDGESRTVEAKESRLEISASERPRYIRSSA
ncbi:MAG: glycosyl hydrolase [Candidatus Aminicenantales bacterium]